MAQGDRDAAVNSDDWAYELGDTVTLLWRIESDGSPSTGQVLGRSEYTFKDPEYLVEYINDRGEISRQWVHDEAIDHPAVSRH